MAFCAPLYFHNNGYVTVSSGKDWWGKMYDPFDPRFEETINKSINEQVKKYLKNSWLIGYFVDNELSWGENGDPVKQYGLCLGTLELDGKSFAKRIFVNILKQKYITIENLNSSWNTKIISWNDFANQPINLNEKLNEPVIFDLKNYLTLFSEKYFKTISEASKKYDPDHLYLGCHFGWQPGIEVIKESYKFCDVVSFNIYAPTLKSEIWDFTEKLGKPCIIGEFHFGSLDRGMFSPGLLEDENHRLIEEKCTPII